jgi:hypothetical protein
MEGRGGCPTGETGIAPTRARCLGEKVLTRRWRVMRVKRCARCREVLPAEAFTPKPQAQTGLSSWCRPCVAARNQQWRAENRGYIETSNAARRIGPFPMTCSACGSDFEARSRLQTRCGPCQLQHLRTRKR